MNRHNTINRADKERAYLLHRRPYSETSLIGYFFTRNYGVVHVLARGAKSRRGSYALLQPNQELLLSWSGRSALKTMTRVELSCRHNLYSGRGLTILFYLNELLIKLLQPADAHTSLYDDFHQFLLVESQQAAEANLRAFELQLFAALGYAVPFEKDYKNGSPIVEENTYIYEPSNGFTLASPENAAFGFSGAQLLALRAGDYTSPAVRSSAKRLARLIIQHLLDNRQLASRSLLTQPVYREFLGED